MPEYVPLTHGRYRHAGNTGPAAGTVFAAPEGGMTVTTNTAIIENRVFYGMVNVQAPDVIIRNCKVILRSSDTYAIDATGVPASLLSRPYSLQIEDCDIDGGIMGAAIAISIFGDTAVRRCHVRGATDGIRLNGDDVLLEDSWVHDQVRYPGGHCDCTQTTGGLNIIMRRNRLEAIKVVDGDLFNAALQVGALSTPLDLLFEDNYADGGGFTINGGTGAATGHTAVWRRNRFGPHYQFAPSRSGVIDGNGSDWDATNVVDATGVPVTA